MESNDKAELDQVTTQPLSKGDDDDAINGDNNNSNSSGSGSNSGNSSESSSTLSDTSNPKLGEIERSASNAKSTDNMLEKTDAPEHRPKPYERWIVLAVSCIGGLLASIQSNALVIAFPDLITALHSDITNIMWVLLAFLLVCAAIVPVTGKLGDIFGQQFLFNMGFLFFTIASLLSGFSQVYNHGVDLIAYRCILGLGGTFLFSNSVAIITDVFAPYGQVGLAQGLFQVAFAAGSVLGPVIGGAFAVKDYRWIFWFNVPPSALCTVFGFIFIRNPPNRKRDSFLNTMRRFDFLGSILLTAFVALTLLALTQSVVPDPNMSSTAGLTCLIVFAVVSLIAFCLVERYVAVDPLIDLKIFVNRTFVVSTLASVFTSFARGNVTYGMILFLQGPYGEDPLTAGIQLIPLGLGIIITGFVSGAITDKVGVKTLAIIGPVISGLGTIGLAVADPGTNYWLIAFALFVIGCGNGIFNSPNGVAGMLSVKPTERGVASAIRLCMAFLPQMFGIVITFALVLNSLTQQELLILFVYGGGNLPPAAIDSFMHAVHIVFWITFASFIFAGMLSFFIPSSFKPNLKAAMPGAPSASSAGPVTAAPSDSTTIEMKSVTDEQPQPEQNGSDEANNKSDA